MNLDNIINFNEVKKVHDTENLKVALKMVATQLYTYLDAKIRLLFEAVYYENISYDADTLDYMRTYDFTTPHVKACIDKILDDGGFDLLSQIEFMKHVDEISLAYFNEVILSINKK